LFDSDLQILKTGEGYLSDSFTLTDVMSRLLRDQDSFGISDQLSIKTGRGLFDGLDFDDALMFKVLRSLSDQVNLQDSLTWAFTRNLLDNFVLDDSTSIVIAYGRSLTDSFEVSDSDPILAIEYGRSLLDYLVMTDTGQACYQGYADPSYFAEDYVRTCYSWANFDEVIELQDSIAFNHSKGVDDQVAVSDNIATIKVAKGLTETISLNETLDIQIRITRLIEDPITFTGNGAVAYQEYGEQS